MKNGFVWPMRGDNSPWTSDGWHPSLGASEIREEAVKNGFVSSDSPVLVSGGEFVSSFLRPPVTAILAELGSFRRFDGAGSSRS